MYDVELVAELLNQVLVAAHRIERRFGPIRTANDFLSSDEGLDHLDGIAMMLIVIGESVKNLDKATNGTLLPRFPEVDWKGAKGVRDVISHHYMDWTRTYLKRYGVIANSTRGIWALTAKGSTVESVDEKDVVRVIRAQLKKDRREGTETEEELNKKIEWQEELLDRILKMSSSAFERLVQRLLRESGFIQVEVTGQAGDGG